MPPPGIGTALGLGLPLGVGIAQSIAQNAASRRAREQNRAELEALLERSRSGQLGITGQQRTILDQQLRRPVLRTAGEARQRAEAFATAQGGASGSDLARLRREQTEVSARGAQEAALQISLADERERERQLQEIEDRVSLEEQQKRERVQGFFGPLSQAAGVAGRLAGAVPETTRATGLFGTPRPVTDFTALETDLRGVLGEGVDQGVLDELIDLERSDPGILNRLVRDIRSQQAAEAGQQGGVRPGAVGRQIAGVF